VITYGSDPMSVSLSARIFPQSDAFLSPEQESAAEALRSAPLSISPAPSSSNSSPYGYDGPADRGAPASGSPYPAFDAAQDRSGPPAPTAMPSYPGYESPSDRGAVAGPSGHYPSFEGGQPDRLGAGGQYAGFEPMFDRGQPGKDLPGGPGGESAYVEEFARLQEGLMRQVRRGDEVRPERP
jgi:hypothetical protein